MNKTQPLPTDAELAAFTASAEWAAYETPMLVDFARAVLAKWGTPAPVGVEPVAIYHGRCTIDCGEHGHLDMELLKMIPAGTKLYTTPQPTQPQARRDALTEAERICDHYATALDGGANEYTRSRECMQAANAIRALKEGKP